MFQFPDKSHPPIPNSQGASVRAFHAQTKCARGPIRKRPWDLRFGPWNLFGNWSVLFLLVTLLTLTAPAQSPAPERGSIIEDRAARKLMQAGDARLEVGETEKALEIWESVIERYPRSDVRFAAHLRLADHLLEESREYDKARVHYEAAAAEDNEDDDLRAYAFLQTGVCFYEAGHFGKCFTIMRDVIEHFPASPRVNEAYFYIGLAHFKLGHYSRAIEALEKVGTALAEDDARIEKVEAGRRLHIKIDDKDFAILEPGQQVDVRCRARSGDEEVVACELVGRHAKMVLGTIVTRLGEPAPGNGILEVRGGDLVKVTYTDAHTAEKTFDEMRHREVLVVGSGVARITDGSYQHPLPAAVLGKPLHLEVSDADHDTGAGPDQLAAAVHIFQRKTADEIDAEVATRVADGEPAETPGGESLKDRIDPLKLVRSLPVTLRESEENGVFRLAIPLRLGTGGADSLQGEPGQFVRLVYTDARHLGDGEAIRTAQAKIIEGNLGEMRVTRTEISDEELALKTRLRTATALTEVGNHYREFGLNEKAGLKYGEALMECEDILEEARRSGGKILEETYVQLWRIYFAMDELDLALGMSRRLLAEFPTSAFVDEAMLQQAHVERKRGNHARAISVYTSLTKLQDSPLRGEGQYFIGECYEDLALKAAAQQATPLFERAFLAYQAVYERFPDSGRVGDAVAKMAAFYYQKEDYTRAVDVFENVLADYPDANFLDVILFNYGRCLYKLGRRAEARRRFDQLISEFPESEIAPEAKKIVDALQKAGS
ncbi:MAG: tetratricopeptide repeat protein [Akkermansiaceae bacterium]|nr:tetratricopeptide repeat protein [Akkermansiaceae bacterium]